MQVKAMVACLLALGVVWIAMSTGPPLEGSRTPEERSAARSSCKACQDRGSCGCTRDGRPRTSCDPCCYQGPQDALPICVD